MSAPGITFTRMQDAAQREAERLAIWESVNPLARGDRAAFEAIVRLIDVIISDAVIMGRLKERARDAARAAEAERAKAKDQPATRAP